MKTGKRRFHPQIDFFYSLHELAVDLVLLFVLPFCPINKLTDSLGMPLVTLSYLKKHLRPTFSSSEPAPCTPVFSDLSLLLLLLLMTSLGSEPESNSSTLAALQIGCLRPPLPLFDLGR